ncbi:hypothetical protein F3Y22_tig00110676pilonHSYRG00285 [Hibiscus syriacus]|uniref:Reelin domain-containing protein n=1 Tax=Hibiscus syriacus TaxID=106335 RepID=A0A6A2ZXV4_HIBSY|nr:hypothetical protein F3Y22_tig00110676pilonHSYRG00285 [Hibiscus syriacus]
MRQSSTVRWLPPPPDCVEVNFDARFNQREKIGWSGVFIRNNEGYELGACRRKMVRIPSPFAAEAQAAEHALELAKYLGFNHIILEGDSRTVMEKLIVAHEDH